MIVPGTQATHWPLAPASPAAQDPQAVLPATMRRLFVPGPRHAEVLQFRTADSRPNSVADGAHLTEAGTPDLTGLPVIFPRYLYLGYNGEGLTANYAGCYAAAEAAYFDGDLPSRLIRAVLSSSAQISDVHRWISGYGLAPGGSGLLNAGSYSGGDLYAVLVLTGSLDGGRFFDSTGLWDVVVQNSSEPPPAGSAVIEEQAAGPDVTRLVYYPAELALRTAALDEHAARYRRFHQRVYAGSGAIGTLSTTYFSLYADYLCPGPNSSVFPVGSAVEAGTKAVADASDFFS